MGVVGQCYHGHKGDHPPPLGGVGGDSKGAFQQAYPEASLHTMPLSTLRSFIQQLSSEHRLDTEREQAVFWVFVEMWRRLNR